MYNLLVVDDEPLILESLCQMLQKNRKDQFFIFKAQNAQEALGILKERHIDVMMTDICMPGMDGIKLRDLVHKQWPDCQNIFLTGQADFMYAKEAVTTETLFYILKTEGDGAILNAIDGAFKRLDELYDRKAEMLRLRMNLQESVPVWKREVIKDILHTESGQQEEMQELSKRIQILQPLFCLEKPFMIVEADMKKISDVMEKDAVSILLEETIPQNFQKLSAFLDRDSFVLFLQREENSVHLVREFMDIALNLCDKTGYQKPDIYIYGQPVTVANSSEAYQCILYRKLETEGGEEICICEPEEKKEKWQKDSTSMQKIIDREKMDDYLVHMEKEAYDTFLDRCFSRVENKGTFYQICTYMEAASALMKAICLYVPDISGLDENTWKKLANYQYHTDFKEAWYYLKRISNVYFSERENVRMSLKESMVQKVNQYVEGHLAQDVSLVSIGDLLGLSPAYASKLYRETAGVSLNKYIVGKRISFAKKLLADENLKMQSIAEQTGLRSASYFIHYFKKYTGYTPQEYRKDCLGHSDKKEENQL